MVNLGDIAVGAEERVDNVVEQGWGNVDETVRPGGLDRVGGVVIGGPSVGAVGEATIGGKVEDAFVRVGGGAEEDEMLQGVWKTRVVWRFCRDRECAAH